MGPISFAAEQCTKEIGVRKVLGASVQSIYALFSKDLLLLVAIAIAIATLLGWYIMRNWLNSFAYRTDISVVVFIVTGLVAMSIALVTISYQALKAALFNPIKSLRSE